MGLQESQRDVVSFLWLKDPTRLTAENNIQVFRFTRVPFGITSSPFLLGATIEHHLGKFGTDISRNILRNIYVDNIITGVDSVPKAIEFYDSTKEYFKQASMNVREWITNSPEVLQHIPSQDHAVGTAKILGLPWDPLWSGLRQLWQSHRVRNDGIATVESQPSTAIWIEMRHW